MIPFQKVARSIRSFLGIGPRRLLHIASDVGEGPVVVLVHGVASSSITWENLVPLLSDDHRVICIDILGHGGSPAPDDAEYTLEEHVQWLAHTIKSLKLSSRYTLVGHSLGSLIVSRYAGTNSKQLDKVVLVSPPVYLVPQEIGDPVVRAATSAYLKAYAYLRAHKEFTLKRAALVAKLMPIPNVFGITESNWRAFSLSLEHCIESQTTATDIARIPVPVEVVYGSLDQFIVPGSMSFINNMRNVTVHRVEFNDHIVHRKLAREVATVIDGSSRIQSAQQIDRVG
ncbi:alpha/beta fold hydrolase [Salinibacterium hongtaonis]|uniref:Alpha/beta hydrolase n=2 Tax=Homoserinimonas hongtaonis TaxID=2079791 RepID=A0A2U1T3M2_9MICO|nr:alpha/beta hydrolase [Salinibacterium hongtaonis]AWB90683.1 alpha/beta hydrolase [Salinibacterium hongtaonis]PWB98458.1 alpha/beta hydrolase [Salinibacterium hongtaonis]